MNGGMQRCFNIMHQLAKHFKLIAIIHQDKQSFLKCKDVFPSMASAKIYSTKDLQVKDIFSLLPTKLEKALRSRWYQRELNRPADGSLIKYHPILKKLLKKQQFDAIILENSATLNAVKIIRRYDKKVKIIYNAHNVDSNLAKAAFERKEIDATQLKSCQKTESDFYKIVDAVITCSENDKEILDHMNGGKLKISIVPNGVNLCGKAYNETIIQDEAGYILFCGSLWSIPNAEGLHWFCKKIWPLVLNEIPSLRLLIVGIGELPAKFAGVMNTRNIELIGEVKDLKPWYQKSAVSVVPLLTGSGTRLKVLEAMGMGVPVISTKKGAEGIDYSEGKNIVIADEENTFAKQIITLLQDKNKQMEIAEHAKALVKQKYDWNIIGNNMANSIKVILSKNEK
jgi:glycosyltransferase involved in cell wall biosynthesis